MISTFFVDSKDSYQVARSLYYPYKLLSLYFWNRLASHTHTHVAILLFFIALPTHSFILNRSIWWLGSYMQYTYSHQLHFRNLVCFQFKIGVGRRENVSTSKVNNKGGLEIGKKLENHRCTASYFPYRNTRSSFQGKWQPIGKRTFPKTNFYWHILRFILQRFAILPKPNVKIIDYQSH